MKNENSNNHCTITDGKPPVVGSAEPEQYWDDEDDWDDEVSNGCCDDCGCYHGHFRWCGHSDEYDDW